ncbi:MAG: c-type cytochrome [Acidimicrobiales bacterium]
MTSSSRPGRSRSRRLGFVVGLVAIATLAACVGADTPEVTNGDPRLEEGRSLYISNCASCHGGAGGGGRGTKLADGAVVAALTEAEQITVVADGRGSMPAFSGRLDAEEIEAVVAYTREVL